MSDFVRDAVLEGLKAPIVQGYAQTLDERQLHFTEDEKKAVKQLRESAVYAEYPKTHLDRHEIKFLMGRICNTPASVNERAASKVEYCMGLNLLDENLVWNKELAAEMAGVTLTEGMASTDSKNTQAQDKGMYGVGSGADKSEPKGQADKGTSQKSDHGDHSHTAGKGDGYMSEEEAKEAVAALEARHAEERAALEGKMPPQFDKNKIPAGSDADGDGKKNEPPIFQKGEKKEADDCDDDMSFPMKKKKEEACAKDQAPAANKAPSPTNDSNTAATDARYKHGAKQNESMEEMEARHAAERAALEAQVENAYGDSGRGSTTADPHASQPGKGSSGSKGQKGTEDGEVPGTPNYAKAKEQDPSHDPKNKGPAQAKNESFEEIEQRLCAVLESKGYQRGTPQWERAYKRGFDMWLHERAQGQNALVEDAGQDQ